MNSIDKNWVDNHIDSNGEVVIPDGVEKIEAEAFRDNEQKKKEKVLLQEIRIS